jgi:hypothetical protein
MATVKVWESMNDGIEDRIWNRIFRDEESRKQVSVKWRDFLGENLNVWVRDGKIKNSSE